MEKPSIPKGTRDFGPTSMSKREFIFQHIRGVFRKYGFQPLETPAMENLSTLTGKYGDEGDRLLFRILNSGDFLEGVDIQKLLARDPGTSSKLTEKGLRYDLTVPFARYVVMNRHDITFPFKRYQIQPVWRADRPQKGRYREFYQCDADVVGTDSLLCEAEIILMINEVFEKLGIKDYTIRMNHRGILSGLADQSGAMNENALFVAMDKLDKMGAEKVKDELLTAGISKQGIAVLFDRLNFSGSNADKINWMRTEFASSQKGTIGATALAEVLNLVSHFGLEENHVHLDLSLARGLSYYTGAIFEVRINHVSIGSVCGGGRYDNLTGIFGMPDVSGIGISFGVDRIYDAMEELTLFPAEANVSTNVLVVTMDEKCFQYGIMVLSSLRSRQIAGEIYPDTSKLKKQLDYANKKMIPFVVIIGSEELETGLLTLKNLATGGQEKITLEKLLQYDF
jgi:histidyl-tRNA synthetase